MMLDVKNHFQDTPSKTVSP